MFFQFGFVIAKNGEKEARLRRMTLKYGRGGEQWLKWGLIDEIRAAEIAFWLTNKIDANND